MSLTLLLLLSIVCGVEFAHSVELTAASNTFKRLHQLEQKLAMTAAPKRRPHLSLLTTDPSPAVSYASVNGLCSASQDALGSLSSASTAGITTLAQCAQYSLDTTASASLTAHYVSYSSSQDKCMWFSDCTCLASSSTCLGGSYWASIAVSDIIKTTPGVTIQTEPQSTVANSAIVNNTSTVVLTAAASSSSGTTESVDSCDTSSSDLMQLFQSSCAINQNVWSTRIIAGSVVLGIVGVVAIAFAVAYKLDQDELASIKQH